MFKTEVFAKQDRLTLMNSPRVAYFPLPIPRAAGIMGGLPSHRQAPCLLCTARKIRMNRLQAIRPFGQRIWLDNLSRDLLHSGELSRWIREDGIAGVTSNPAIFTRPSATTPATPPRYWR